MNCENFKLVRWISILLAIGLQLCVLIFESIGFIAKYRSHMREFVKLVGWSLFGRFLLAKKEKINSNLQPGILILILWSLFKWFLELSCGQVLDTLLGLPLLLLWRLRNLIHLMFSLSPPLSQYISGMTKKKPPEKLQGKKPNWGKRDFVNNLVWEGMDLKFEISEPNVKENC